MGEGQPLNPLSWVGTFALAILAVPRLLWPSSRKGECIVAALGALLRSMALAGHPQAQRQLVAARAGVWTVHRMPCGGALSCGSARSNL